MTAAGVDSGVRCYSLRRANPFRGVAAVDESELNEMGGCEWSAGGRGEQPFIASSSGTEHTEPGTGAPHRDAVRLERQVRNAAGRRLNSQWFRREAGRAEGLEHQAGAGLEGRHLPEAAFPPLSLREDWSGSEEQALVSDYIAWLAPYLLTLPWLDETVRRRLEGQATRRALLVDAIWRLYPRILDQDLLNRARVEARLRRASD